MSQRLQLSLTGIKRNQPSGISEDGSLHEMVSMRPRDGAWRVTGDKEQNRQFLSGYRFEFMHKISPNRIAWWFTIDSGKAIGYYLMEADETAVDANTSFDTYSGTQEEVSFAALGNVVIMIDQNDEVLQAYLFDSESDTYSLVGDLLPDLIDATIYEAADGTGSTLQLANASEWTADDQAAALATEIAAQRESGYWINKLYFRYAYELFDGSIVKHSQPIRINGGTFDDWVYDTSTYWETTFNKFIAYFDISVSTADIEILQGAYKGIIKSVNIYACLPNESVLTAESGSPRDIVHTDPVIADVNNFYLVKKIALEELVSTTVNIFDGNDISGIALENSMPVDNLTAHTIYSDTPFNYNQRIFWSKVKNTMFSGFNPNMSNPYAGSVTSATSVRLYIETTIQTNQGERVVVSQSSIALLNYTNHLGFLACYAYPDSRASKIKIILYDTTSGTYTYKDEIALTAHKHFNFAFVEDAEFDDDTVVVISSEVKTYWDYNRIQATELMNAFYFPAVNSYRVGHGTVVGLSANAIAISTGQFGEYPMYAFTTDGIWTLQIGNEEVLIQTIKPLSRHVCNNAGSILPIDGGSTFSTDKGLFIISGEKPIEISKEAEGSRLSEISTNSDYTAMLISTSANNLTCDHTFLEYLALANIAYDFKNNEIIVSASDNQYSWVYSIDNGIWYKINQIWDYFIDNFPVMYGVHLTNQDIEDLTTELTTGNKVILIETRPIRFGFSGLKKLTRMLIECYFLVNTAHTLQIQVFGSSDGENYALAYHDIVSPSTLQRLLVGRIIYSCEYFILVIASSSVDYDGLIKHIDIDMSSKFTKKLRLYM